MKFNLNTKAIIDKENNDSETLIITGVASDTQKDRYNEYVTPETLKSLCEQARNLNLHYNHQIDKIIGVIIDAKIINNQLMIKAKILPEYSEQLRHNLEFGINYGLSIAGIPKIKKNDGGIVGYDLVEISLTEEPANPNTYATVEINDTKNIKASCLDGMCQIINKEFKNMSKKNNEEKNMKNSMKTKEAESSTEYITADDLNNALNDYKEELLNTLREEFKNDIVKTVLDELGDSEDEEEEPNNEELKDLTKAMENTVEKCFQEFEKKYFKKLEEKRNPTEYSKFQKNIKNDIEEKTVKNNNKMTIQQISETIGGN